MSKVRVVITEIARGRRGRPEWMLERSWPWAVCAALSWSVFAWGRVIGTSGSLQSAVAIVATANTVGLGLIVLRRRDQAEWLAAAFRTAGESDAVVFSRFNREPQPCPCGCSRIVDDPTGYIPSMTRWVLAAGRLCEQVAGSMHARGSVRLEHWELIDDTAALTELLVDICHHGVTSQLRFELFGIASIWESRWDDAEEAMSAELPEAQYRLWKASTVGARNGRHGALTRAPDPAEYRLPDEAGVH